MPAVSILGNGEIDVEVLLLGREGALQLFRRGRRIGAWHVEQQTIGEDSRRGRNREGTARQGLSIDVQAPKSPWAKCQRGELELEQILEEAILYLKVLWTEQDALGPEHRLHLPHAAISYRRGPTSKESAKWIGQIS
jgi:hypothetical protein